ASLHADPFVRVFGALREAFLHVLFDGLFDDAADAEDLRIDRDRNMPDARAALRRTERHLALDLNAIGKTRWMNDEAVRLALERAILDHLEVLADRLSKHIGPIGAREHPDRPRALLRIVRHLTLPTAGRRSVPPDVESRT